MSDSGVGLAVDGGNFTLNDISGDMEVDKQDLTFSSTAIIIPTVIFGLLVVVLVIYYVWNCVTNYLEAQEEEKIAAEQAAKKVPIAEPEDFTVPIPADNSVPPADGADVEDTNATDGDIEEGKHGT